MAALVEQWVTTADPRWAETGLTYRQVDYWTKTGILVCADPAPGSGNARTWPESEIAVAARIMRLRKAGLELEAAVAVARMGVGVHGIAPGIRIEVAP